MTCRVHYQISCLLEDIDGDDKYTEWERTFIWSIAKQIEGQSEAKLSDKQQEVLERIWNKA